MCFVCGSSQLHLGLKGEQTMMPSGKREAKMCPLVRFTCGLNPLFRLKGNVVLSDSITFGLGGAFNLKERLAFIPS